MADPNLDQIGQWLLNNQDKAGSPDYVTMSNAYRQMSAQPQPAPPISGIDMTPPSVTPNFGIDFNQPDEQVRSQIAAIPDEQQRTRAMNAWADAYVARENKDAGWGRTADNVVRSVARGIPGGTWLDELTAATSSNPDEVLAYQRARDRDWASRNPWTNVAGNVAGGVLSAPMTIVRGATALPWLANTAIGTVIGGVQGAGEGTTPESRTSDAAWGAGIGGVSSAVLGALANAYTSRWSRANVTPEVDQAASNLNVPLPYFARSENPKVQAMGRQTAQERPGSNLATAWIAAREGTDEAGSNIVRNVTGAPRETAPYTVGQAVQGGMENAVEGANQRIAQVSRDIENLLPPGHRADTPQLRQTMTDIIGERGAAGHLNPEAGMGQTMSIATEPSGPTWRGLSRYTTELGQDIGRPDIVPRELPRADQARLYAAVQGTDRPNIVEAAAGPQGRAMFEQGTAQQAELAQLRDTIAGAIRNRQPEQLVNLAHNAATLSGGGTRLNQLDLILQNLSPGDRRQLGAGVLAKIQNDAGGVPSGVARRLADLPQATRDLLFPPGTQLAAQVNDLQTVAGRVGAVDSMAHAGSARTIAQEMKRYGVGATPAAAGSAYLASQLGGGPLVQGAVAAVPYLAAGAKMLNDRVVRPYVLQNGLPPWLVDSINAGGFGVPRASLNMLPSE
ncbi:hypothetical protein ABIG06_006236 [Bradyrhizobium sp. USDA 326]|uniref:hypothetical protein n=1 Tax=unclassified Bradyrhizobium TaxID=2631580 RepID=UPI003517F903